MQTVGVSATVPLGPRVRVDLAHQRVWRDGAPVDLRPKAWQALAYLMGRPGALVTADELLDALWPRQEISAKTLANLMSELRAALDGGPTPTPLLQTVHRRGYRLQPPPAAPGTANPANSATSTADAARSPPPPAAAGPEPPPPARRTLVGREAERVRLDLLLSRAEAGQRQVAWLLGEPGLGKTALLDHFIAWVAAGRAVAGRGACLELCSEREPFAPVLALLADLCSGPLAGPARAALRRCAPTWLAQLPWLVQPDELPALRHGLAGMGIGRMLREFGALVQALCSHHPLVLVLEDLHWADAATVDLLQLLATDRAPARLLVVASWQPQRARLAGHPVAALAERVPAPGGATVLPLKALSDDEVGQVIASRFDDPGLAAPLRAWAVQQSMGVPLYLEAALDHLRDSGALAWQQGRWRLAAAPCPQAVAEPLRALIHAGLDRLDAPTRALLEAASAVGMQVPTQLLAAALEQAPEAVERACDTLARQSAYLRAEAPVHWPDGSCGGGYAFTHDIYRRALYDRLAPALRQALHRRVARRLEAGWDGQLAPVAGQLAATYARAAMPDATARVLEMTAHLSAQRFAYGATLDALQACLQQLALMPESTARHTTEVRVQLMLGNMALNHQGLASPVVLPAFERAQALAHAGGALREQLRAQLGATVAHTACFRPAPARRLARDTVALAEAHQPTLAAVAHHYAGLAEAIAGDLPAACRHQAKALALTPDPVLPLYFDVHSSARLHLGRALCWMGLADQGLAALEAALARGRSHCTPADFVHKLVWAGDTCRLHGLARAGPLLAEALSQAEAFDLPGLRGAARIGLACLPPPGARDTGHLAALAAAHGQPGDHHTVLTTCLALAEAHLAQGRPDAAQAAWAEARAVTPAGAMFDAELHRLKGELLAAGQGTAVQAAQALADGLAVARRQQARQHALRCAMGLFRLQRGDGPSRDTLADALAQVREGDALPDVQQARALLGG